MHSKLLVRLLKPRQLPPPDPNCRQYSFAQTALLLRNFERSKVISKNLHKGTK